MSAPKQQQQPAAKPAADTAKARRAAALGNLFDDPIVEADGTGEQVTLSSVQRESRYVPTTTSSGTVSFEALVLVEPTVSVNVVQRTGASLNTHTVKVMVISEVPPPDPIRDESNAIINNPKCLVRAANLLSIHTPDNVEWHKNEPHRISVIGSGKDPKATSNDSTGAAPQQKTPRVLYDGKRGGQAKFGVLAMGSVIDIRTNKAADLSEKLLPWDIVTFSNVTYSVEQGKDNSSKGGKNNANVFYENFSGGGIQLLSHWFQAANRHNEILAILFGLAFSRIPNFPPLVYRTDFDRDAAKDKFDRKFHEQQQEKEKKEALKNNTPFVPMSYEEALSRRAAESDGATYSHEMTKKDARKMTEEGLTERSKRELNLAQFIVPTVLPSPLTLRYLKGNKFGWKAWVFPKDAKGETQYRIDPTNADMFRYILQEQQNQPQQNKAGDRKEVIYEEEKGGKKIRMSPKFSFSITLAQSLPVEPMVGETLTAEGKTQRKADFQTVSIAVHNNGVCLYPYGIAEPAAMIHVLPVLIASTPAANLCYPSDIPAVASNTPAVTSGSLTYPLAGSMKAFDFPARGQATPKDVTTFILDHAAGVINGGYPIKPTHAQQLIELKSNQVGATVVSTNMTDSNVVNPWYKSHVIGSTKHSPVQNWFETQVNFEAEGKTHFQNFVVCNHALKDFDRFPELEMLINALKLTSDPYDNACELFGKLFVDLANKTAGIGLGPKELSTANPTTIARNLATINAYAAELATAGNLDKLPFEPSKMSTIFGPLFARDAQPDFSPATGPGFRYDVFGIKHNYLKTRGMKDYLGNDFYIDVLYPTQEEAYGRVAEGIEKKHLEPYFLYKPRLDAKVAQLEAAKAKARADAAAPGAASKPPAPKAKAVAQQKEPDSDMTDVPHADEGSIPAPTEEIDESAAKAKPAPPAAAVAKVGQVRVTPDSTVKQPPKAKAKANPAPPAPVAPAVVSPAPEAMDGF